MSSDSRKPYRAIFTDRVLRNNLVLVEGVGLCPLVGGATSLKNSVTMFLCATVTLVLTSLLMMGIHRKISTSLRIPLHTLFASVLLCGEAFLINETISTELYASLYLFLPLLAVTTLFAYHGNNAMVGFSHRAALVDAFSSSLGFGIVLCLVGALREIFAKRTLWDIPLPLSFDLPEATLPFAAFILLGLLAALLQHGNAKVEERARRNQTTIGGGTYDNQ